MHLGAHAEYLCLSEKAVAVLFGGLTATHFLKNQAALKENQKILINGASGTVGMASVQLAKYLGAEITAVCSTANLEMVKSLGVDNVIDYTKNDVTKSAENFDVILDAVGNLSLSSCNQLLKTNGKLISINAGLFTNLLSIFKKNLICGVAAESKDNLEFLKTVVEAGNIKAVIDEVYVLDKIVEAHRYVDKGHKKGNVVLSI